jgi:putative nucleotidyltransferase with HDIG domain
MIDFNKAKQAFEEYIENYDLNDSKIDLKLRHTYGVITFSESIARDLNLSDEDIELAKLIALLHDIGRFEQAKVYSDFHDHKNVDHCLLGVQILFDKGLIREFIDDNQYDNIIYKAILNHGKFKIEDGLSDRELLHTNVIRDADKTDNFRVKLTDDFSAIFNSSYDLLSNDVISDNIYGDFMNHRLILTTDRKTHMDHWVSYLAFIFDFNFTA